MKIGLLMESSAWGGAEIHAVGLTRALLDRGHSPVLVGLSVNAHKIQSERVAGQIPLACLEIPRPPAKMGYQEWRRAFAGREWDVCMLIKGDIDSGGGWAIDLAARRTFRNYLVLEQKDADPIPTRTSRLHFGLIPGLGLWWYAAHARRRLRSLGPRLIVCVSDANRKRLIGEHGFPERKMFTVRNGIDVQRFRRDEESRERWRSRWRISDSTLVFGAVGRLHRIKGYDVALASFETLLQRLPTLDARLILVGEGPEEQALQAQAAQIRPRDRVLFLSFQQKPEEVLSAFDVFVMPSVSEGLPLALAEAMACECCPIATGVGGIGEAISQPDLGWLVPADRKDQFAEAMVDAALRTPEERAAIGRRAREQANRHFDATVQFEALARIIESMGPLEQIELGVRQTMGQEKHS